MTIHMAIQLCLKNLWPLDMSMAEKSALKVCFARIKVNEVSPLYAFRQMNTVALKH